MSGRILDSNTFAGLVKGLAACERLCRAKHRLCNARDRQAVGLGAETDSEGFEKGSEVL